jgi:hypothetical protein
MHFEKEVWQFDCGPSHPPLREGLLRHEEPRLSKSLLLPGVPTYRPDALARHRNPFQLVGS